jgi:hypothetical protein
MTILRHASSAFQSPARSVPLRQRLFGLSPTEASFDTRGFAVADPLRQASLEKIGRTFIGGYNAALAAGDVTELLQHVRDVSPPERGFAVEGATMAVAIADALPFRQLNLTECLGAFEHEFTYLAHVGAGWALGRIPWRRRRLFAALDPIHWWLAFDGLGFHDAYFKHRRALAGWRRERDGYAARAYDQGIGRALWFVAGGSTAAAIRLVTTLPASRQSDLWSGLGLAMAYAGPANPDEIDSVLRAAGAHAANFAQGVAFACEARTRAGYVPDNTDVAARAVSGNNAHGLAELVCDARRRLPAIDGDPPRYEIWRRDVAAALRHRS